MDDECQILDDDDPLIAEVDIYLTRIFADQLYIFQYPLRANNLQYENNSNSTFVNARLKPKNKLVQLDCSLDNQSNFHAQENEKRASEHLSLSNENHQAFNRLTLSSTNLTPGENYKRYAVGTLTSNGLQLSPLNAIFQLRPDFDTTSSILLAQRPLSIDDDEIDNEANFSKQSISSTDDATTDEEINEKQPNELVTMKFWRPEGRLQREKKIRSYNYIERARNEERWIDFAYYSPQETPAIDLRYQWLMRDNLEQNRLPIRWRKTVSIQDYFQLLFLNKNITYETNKLSIESSVINEQKPLIIPPTKPKKKKKTDAEKSPKKPPRKSRSSTRKSTDTSVEPTTTISTPISLPKTIIKQDPETIQNELLSFMKRRFGYRPYFKLSEINIAIKLELISSPPGHPLASGVTEASILRAAAEIGAIYVNKKWPKNLKQEPVFINVQMGDKYDILRRYVADLLEKCDSFQFTELRSRIKQENQTQQYPIHEVKKFVKDHCITRSSRKGVLYCVKGTLVK